MTLRNISSDYHNDLTCEQRFFPFCSSSELLQYVIERCSPRGGIQRLHAENVVSLVQIAYCVWTDGMLIFWDELHASPFGFCTMREYDSLEISPVFLDVENSEFIKTNNHIGSFAFIFPNAQIKEFIDNAIDILTCDLPCHYECTKIWSTQGWLWDRLAGNKRGTGEWFYVTLPNSELIEYAKKQRKSIDYA